MKYLGETSLKKLISLIKTAINGKQDKITANGILKCDGDGGFTTVSTTYTTSTLGKSGWASKTYSFEIDYPNEKYDISISVAPTATSTEFDAFASAKICGSATTNSVTALGTVPTIDIPIIIKAVSK